MLQQLSLELILQLSYHPSKGLVGSFHLAIALGMVCHCGQLTYPRLGAKLFYHLTCKALHWSVSIFLGALKIEINPS